jgi:hypothetical protein
MFCLKLKYDSQLCKSKLYGIWRKIRIILRILIYIGLYFWDTSFPYVPVLKVYLFTFYCQLLFPSITKCSSRWRPFYLTFKKIKTSYSDFSTNDFCIIRILVIVRKQRNKGYSKFLLSRKYCIISFMESILSTFKCL